MCENSGKKKIKLCHVQVLPILSGVQKEMVEILELLDKELFDITVICQEEGPLTEVLEQIDCRVITLSSMKREITLLQDFRTLLKLWSIFRERQFDIVHTHSSKPGILGRVAARMAGTSFICHHVHGFAFHEFTSRWNNMFFGFMEKIVSRLSHKVIFVNNEERKQARAKNIVPPQKALTIYNGVDLDLYSQNSANSARDLMDVSDDRFVLGFVGRFWEQKDPMAFLQTINCLKNKGYSPANIQAVMVGEGPFYEEMKRYVQMQCLNGQVKFLGWVEDVYRYLPGFDLMVSTSLWEGLPKVLIEASASGIPIVATDIKGNREVVDVGINGFLCPPKAPNAFARVIESLYHDKKIRSELSSKCRKKAEMFFDSDTEVREISDMYMKGLNINA